MVAETMPTVAQNPATPILELGHELTPPPPQKPLTEPLRAFILVQRELNQ